ncbi:MAG: DUF1415 domain-containing protein [Pseudomonadota bacterium]|nr:DUF1415 domain-containing protein [Pseudomonadota bacterium]
MTTVPAINNEEIIDATRRWLEKAVIGLGLCPFAESVYVRDGVRFQVSEQSSAAGLLAQLRSELMHLHRADARQCETTLLIHPWVLTDFMEFNEFLALCDDAVSELELEGEIQVASFHPQYQFAGTQPDDIENYTNRSPFPTLHLLREASVERALAGVPDPQSIYENNILRLRELGFPGWQALWKDKGHH